MRRAAKYIFALLLFSLTINGNTQIHIQNRDYGFIGDQVFYWIDNPGKAELSEVIEKQSSGAFQPSDQEIIVHSSPRPVYWFYFEARSALDEDVWLKVNNSNLAEVDFFKLNDNGVVIDEKRTGCLFPDGSGEYQSDMFWFRLIEGEDNNSYRFFIRLKALLTLEAPIEIGAKDELFKSEQRSNAMGLFFIGALVIMCLYNISLFVFTKDSIYAYYSLYILAVTFGTTFLNNYPVIENFVGRTIAYNYTACWLWTSLVGIGLFTIKYLRIKERSKSIFTILWVEMGGILLLAVLNLFIPVEQLSLAYQLTVVVFYVTCLLTAYYFLVKTKDGRSRLYAIGWTIVMLGGMLYLMVINGVMIYTPVTRNIMYIGVTCEVLIFSIALAKRLNRLKARQEHLNVALQETNQILEQNNESLDSFNYHVSHDLKTVMNNSSALSRMIEKYNEKGDQKKVAEIVRKLKQVTANGTETVQSFLSLGKIGSILQDHPNSKIELKKEVESVLARNNLNHQIKVKIEVDQIGKMMMHPKALESIFLNFFTNSIKYCDNEPTAKIAFLKEPGYDVFIYSDNGIGIDMEKYGDLLFKPFQRPASSDLKEGTGVGLYLVKRIVKGYGGRIVVTSAPGTGTTFRLEFPGV